MAEIFLVISLLGFIIFFSAICVFRIEDSPNGKCIGDYVKEKRNSINPDNGSRRRWND